MLISFIADVGWHWFVFNFINSRVINKTRSFWSFLHSSSPSNSIPKALLSLRVWENKCLSCKAIEANIVRHIPGGNYVTTQSVLTLYFDHNTNSDYVRNATDYTIIVGILYKYRWWILQNKLGLETVERRQNTVVRFKSLLLSAFILI